MLIRITPRFLIRMISSESIMQINWNILISSILVLIGILSLKTNCVDYIPHFCIFEKLTSFPCPGCGIIRSLRCIDNCRFVDSIKYNPCGFLIVGLLISQIPMRILVIIDKNKNTLINDISSIMDRIVILSLIIFWTYRIIHIINFKF